MSYLNEFATKKILYKAGKPERGTIFEIYTDGTIKIIRKLTLASLHIPVRIQNWMDIVRSSKENKNSIRVTIIVNDHNRNNEIISNQIATLEKKKDEWFLELSNNNEIKMRIAQYRSSKVTCIIYGLKPAKLFYKNKELLKHNSVKEEKNIQWLLGSKRRGSSFNIYQTNTKQLQIECFCWQGKSGQIELSQELWRYVKDWWKLKNRYVIGAIDDGTKSVLKFSQRKKKKRLVKKIIIPYNGKRKKIKIVFTHPVFELSENAKKDLTLTKELQQAGYNIKQLTTNWTDKPRHKDEEFEEKVWNILKCAFTEADSEIFPEVKITTAFTPKITKRIDGLLVRKELLGLIELKTSEDIKNSELDEVIGELLLLQENISEKKIVTLLFINTEVTTTEQARIITKLYGIANNIILIGREEVEVLLRNPKLLLERLEIIQTVHQKKNTKELIIHPETLQVVLTKKLEGEAYTILEQLIQTQEKSFELIEQYCFLMNIPIADFYLLYNKNVKQNEGKTSIELAMKRRKISSKAIILDMKPLQNLHSDLIRNNSRTILEEKSKHKATVDYYVLLKNFTTLLTTLPPSCRVIGFKYFRREQGAVFERNTRNLLEDMGFEVVSNLLFSYYGKHFEIDHLAFKDKTIQLISCKDRSSFRYLPNLYSKIIFAFGQLYLNQKTLYNAKGKLHIRVKKEFLFTLKKKFKAFKSPDHSLILTS
ncbi:MAG: hypothetical protein GPJ52_04240 [Candidatus Heimdallarchaeota archaeon]|nr:hypothetical protein [Candidatus Heimdallarchaeota archaeon]